MKSKILSHPSKMPCPAISLDARACKTGSKLAEIEGTVCHDCYALKGFYRMPNTRNAMQRRMDFMTSLEFVPKQFTRIAPRSAKLVLPVHKVISVSIAEAVGIRT